MSAMIPFAALVLAAAPVAPVPPPPQAGVRAVAMATAEIVAAARSTIEAGPQEPRRQVRREAGGRILIEFE